MSWGYTSQKDWDEENLSLEPGNPDGMTYYPGEPKVPQAPPDYSRMTRGNGWPFNRDNIDYSPDIDEDHDDWKED